MDPRSVLAARITELAAGRSVPLLVALDGRSGAGKSTLAHALGAEQGWPVVDGDDFYVGGTADEWDAMPAQERAMRCIDWRRQRLVLEALARGERASWRPYDWQADNGRLAERPLTCDPNSVVIVDGAYSARPELGDLTELKVLLDAPEEVRRARLVQREGESYSEEWFARWGVGEEHYFVNVMPPDAFDLVITTA